MTFTVIAITTRTALYDNPPTPKSAIDVRLRPSDPELDHIDLTFYGDGFEEGKKFRMGQTYTLELVK
jgi:hypothetical protein